jgi:hypothetical protein
MQTIKILPESSLSEQPIYRAMCGDRQATGQTPGQALDTLEAELATEPSDHMGETLVILQRFRPDDFFTAEQQQRLQDLMEQHHAAIAQGTPLPSHLQIELDNLVEAELEANIQRSQRLLQRSERAN